MPYLLNVVYLLLVAVLSPWLLYRALRYGKYRQGAAAKWLGHAPLRDSDRPCAWLHAVSVGEVNLLAPLLAELAARYPHWEFVISTTSAAGYGLAQKKYAAHTVFYAPLDFTWAVRAAFERIRPQVLVLAELELWPNLIAEAHRRQVRVAVFNGRLSEKSFRGYRRLRPLVQRVLAKIDVIGAQDETYAERFRALGAPRVEVTGSLKFDGAEADRNNPRTRKLAELAGIRPGDVVFLAGSTQAPEEGFALQTYLQLRERHPELRLILVPRHPERFDEVAEILQRSGVPWQRRSELDDCPSATNKRVLLVDVIGELGAWWGTAQIGFVGGSLLNQRGGQNMIEPAAYGVAIALGPNTWNFRDVVRHLQAREGLMVVQNGAELTAFVKRCLLDPDFAYDLGARARQAVLEQRGATLRTANLLGVCFGEAPSTHRGAADRSHAA